MKTNLEQMLKKICSSLTIKLRGQNAVIIDEKLPEGENVISDEFNKEALMSEHLDDHPITKGYIHDNYINNYKNMMLNSGIKEKYPDFPDSVIDELKTKHPSNWSRWLTEGTDEKFEHAKQESKSCLQLSEDLDKMLKKHELSQEGMDEYRRNMLGHGIERDYKITNKQTTELLYYKRLTDWPEVLKDESKRISDETSRGKEMCDELSEDLKDVCEFLKGNPARPMTEEEIDNLEPDENYNGPVIKLDLNLEDLKGIQSGHAQETEPAPKKEIKFKLNLHKQATEKAYLLLKVKETRQPTAEDFNKYGDLFVKTMKDNDEFWLGTADTKTGGMYTAVRDNGKLYYDSAETSYSLSAKEIISIDGLEYSSVKPGQTMLFNGTPVIYLGEDLVMTKGCISESVSYDNLDRTMEEYNKNHYFEPGEDAVLSCFDLSKGEVEPPNVDKLLNEKVGTRALDLNIEISGD